MHSSFELSHSFWNFLIVFAFAWVLLYTAEPYWVQVGGVVSKSLCAWYAFVFALLLAFILLVVYLIMRTVRKKALSKHAVGFMDQLGISPNPEESFRSTPGERPMDKMRNILDSLKETTPVEKSKNPLGDLVAATKSASVKPAKSLSAL